LGNLRARLASTPEDRDLQTYLASASKDITNALGICLRVANRSEYGSQEKHRARRYLGILQNVQRLLGEVGRLQPNIDMADPDLQSEKDKKPASPKIEVQEPEVEVL
jgi:hypothetical protein